MADPEEQMWSWAATTTAAAFVAAASIAAAGVAAAYTHTDERAPPKERLTAAEQRDGDTIGAGAFEACRLSDGVTCYRRYGWVENAGAAVVVLIHGGTIPSPVFAPMAAVGVADGLRVLTYDQYGKGYSDRLAQGGPFGLPVCSRQLRELLDHLGPGAAPGGGAIQGAYRVPLLIIHTKFNRARLKL